MVSNRLRSLSLLVMMLLVLTGVLSKWSMVSADSAANSLESIVIHQATSANTTAHITTISDSSLNGNVNVRPILTPLHTNGASLNPHPVGVFYSAANQWAIFNQAFDSMPVGPQFNIYVPADNALSFVHRHNANLGLSTSPLDHPHLNNNADALVFTTNNWNPPGGSGVYNSNYTAVEFNGSAWQIVSNQLDANNSLNEGAAFNIFVPPFGASAFAYTVTSLNAGIAVIDHPALNGNPNAYPHVQARVHPTDVFKTVYGPVAVSYDEALQRWTILRLDQVAIPFGAVFNVFVPPSTPQLDLFVPDDMLNGPYHSNDPFSVGLGIFQQDRLAAVPNQLTLFGKPTDLDTLTGLLFQQRGGSLGLLQSVVLGPEAEMRLVSTGISAETMRVIAESEGLFDIDIDPNYIVAAPWAIGGAPWAIGGAPWAIGGAPWAIGGAPWTLDPDDSVGSDPAHAFPWQQWIFDTADGINLFTSDGARTVPHTGDGTRIVIFDTSPFESDGTNSVPALSQPINVSHPVNVLETTGTGMIDSLSEHGLFVASLAHYVAPDAQLELVRVLGEDATGDGATLVLRLQELADSAGDLSNVIVNLSLGYLPEFDPSADTATEAEVAALQLAIQNLRDKGALVIAASGNHSSWTEGIDGVQDPAFDYFGAFERFNSAIPARWPETIDVTGYVINRYGDRVHSCFANGRPVGGNTADNVARGFNHFDGSPSIAAPSGSGIDDEQIDFGTSFNDVYTCQQGNNFSTFTLQQMCGNNRESSYDCRSAVLGVTTEGYSHWVGTSFGAPLVSGMIALLREACPSASAAAMEMHLQDSYLSDVDAGGLGTLDVTHLLQSCPASTVTASTLASTAANAQSRTFMLPLVAFFILTLFAALRLSTPQRQRTSSSL